MLSPPSPPARLVELPVADQLVIRENSAEAVFLNIAPEVKYDRAIVSYNGDAAKLEQIDIRTGSLQKVGAWRSLVTGTSQGRSIADIRLPLVATRLDVRIRLNSATDRPRLLTIALGLPPAQTKSSDQAKAMTIPSETWKSDWKTAHGIGSAAAVIAFWRTALGMDEMPATLSSFLASAKVSQTSDSVSSLALAGGQFRGVLSYGSYFLGMHDLELWVGASLPVICKIGQSYEVVVGFDAKGNPQVLNRGTIAGVDRKTFYNGWATSGFAVVLIHPNPLGTPESTGPERWLNKEHDG